MLKIAIYGKGGIGKSTLTSNLSICLTKMGYKVMQIGCDPKSDSTRLLTGGEKIPTVLDVLRSGIEPETDDVIKTGSMGIICAEAGGPKPGSGCAGRGIITAFELFEELEVYDKMKPDVVLYDVLGDVVCGGFAMPIRKGYADKVYVVTSGEMMAMYAADNIISAVKSFNPRGYGELGGIILNRRNVENETELIERFSKDAGVPVVGDIPRDPSVQTAENAGKTVCEMFPESDAAQAYMKVAKELMKN